MILKELFNKVDKDVVITTLVNLYPTSDVGSYEHAWDVINSIEPEPSDGTIICLARHYYDWKEDWEFDDLGIDDEITVHGENPNSELDEHTGRSGRNIHWAIELSPWSKWLGWEVEVQTDDPRCNNDAKVLANILWEMTYCGYTQEAIANEVAELDELVKSIDEG
jgi:hypothetical protein